MATTLSLYEQERLQRIKENQARMNALGLTKQTSILDMMFQARKPTSNFNNKDKVRQVKSSKSFERTRSSKRIQGHRPQYAPVDNPDSDKPEGYVHEEHEYNKNGNRIEVSLNPDVTPEEKDKQLFQKLMGRRCTSQGRGSVYDSQVGICCHFCRQKKLCGEPNCPRCEKRSTSEECIGKTECSRCHSATGKFCRACLLIRYGEEMVAARATENWLCPHCYEKDHPEEHWICNSSICLTRKKMRPTGIAIFDAQARGFPSVGHWLQAQLKDQHRNPAAAADAPPPPPSNPPPAATAFLSVPPPLPPLPPPPATAAPPAATPAPPPATPAPVTPAQGAGQRSRCVHTPAQDSVDTVGARLRCAYEEEAAADKTTLSAQRASKRTKTGPHTPLANQDENTTPSSDTRSSSLRRRVNNVNNAAGETAGRQTRSPNTSKATSPKRAKTLSLNENTTTGCLRRSTRAK